MLRRVAEPVLANVATNQLVQKMPVETPKGRRSRQAVTHLEAVGRTLAGIAPWLGCTGLVGAEEEARANSAEQARRGLANILTSEAADHLDFTAGAQNLVDAAFLVLGLARAHAELWEKLEPSVRDRLVAALQSTRKFKPGQNNWLLFAAMIEGFLKSVGAEWREGPIEAGVTAHQTWYKGDGAYGDGEQFHWDYYNSFVIQPMLLSVPRP